MKRLLLAITILSLGNCAFGQKDILRTQISGTMVQEFEASVSNEPIVKFTVKDSTDGWTYLRAYARNGESDYILKTRLSGTAVQGFDASPNYIIGFTAVNSGDWRCLIAESDAGTSDTIIKTKLSSTGVQTNSCFDPNCVVGFAKLQVGDTVYLQIICDAAGTEEKTAEPKFTFELGPISPNPFSDYTRISYSIAKAGRVSLKIYDRVGRMTAKLVDENKEAGTYSVNWSRVDDTGRKVKAGTYFVRLYTGEFKTEKIVIVK